MANLDSTIFAYHYPPQLAYVTTFDLPHAHNFHLQYPIFNLLKNPDLPTKQPTYSPIYPLT